MATDYLRNRPFLCVEISYRPAKNIRTNRAGWQHQQNALQAFDRVAIMDRVNNPMKYQVVIDVINSAVIRNSTGIDETHLKAEYMSRYKDEIKDALTIWAHREAANNIETTKALAALADAQAEATSADAAD